MNSKRIFVFALIALILFTLHLSAQKNKSATEKKGQPLIIAPQVAAVMDADVSQRKNRVDIPITYLQTLHLPAQLNQIYPVFLFQIKNADLNFVAPQETPDMLKANHFVFARIYRSENGVAGEIVKEYFIRFDLEETLKGFQPEALNYYSIAGDIFPPAPTCWPWQSALRISPRSPPATLNFHCPISPA